MNSKLKTKDITYIAIFSAIISIISQLSIPLPYGVPLTLQTLIIPFVGIILGARNGTIATFIYILLGAVGIPVFANLTSGIGVILGPTGGFIITFPILALTAGIGCRKNKFVFLLLLIVGNLINYVVGLLFFINFTEYDFKTSFGYAVLPFIPTAIIKMIIVFLFADKIKYITSKKGLKL